MTYQESKLAELRIAAEARRLAQKYPAHFPPGRLGVWYGWSLYAGFHLNSSVQGQPTHHMGYTEEAALLWLLGQLVRS